ncbi:MAG: dTDP-4-dehydrorhamnose 3,5-epimerase [Candidatus Omnitrophica bacterium]|nr:dTDP-4-dehydrorhamnose 3,5-epimerase [Candidatus Omnitrophota bacterium]
MEIVEKGLKGVFVVKLAPLWDERGYFMRTYDDRAFREKGLHREWVNENHSYSEKKGTVRGLHFQFQPFAETKLIRALYGDIYVVFLDLRKGSETFGEWGSEMLKGNGEKMLYVGRGFAMGICSLTDKCALQYKMDNYYAPDKQGAIKWNDPDIGIDWPVNDPVISDRDLGAWSFKEFNDKFGGLEG